MSIERSTTLKRTEGLMTAAVESDLVILNLASNNYLGLDDVGRRIWELLAEPRRVDDLCRQLVGEYQGEPDQIATDVLRFVNELAGEGLLGVVDEKPA